MGWEVGQWVGTGFGIILGRDVGTRIGPGWTPSLPATHMQDLAGCQPEASCHGGYSQRNRL